MADVTKGNGMKPEMKWIVWQASMTILVGFIFVYTVISNSKAIGRNDSEIRRIQREVLENRASLGVIGERVSGIGNDVVEIKKMLRDMHTTRKSR